MPDLEDRDLGPARHPEGTPSRPTADRPFGRPPRLSRRDICESATEIGFSNLTIQAVARRLGASSSAVYSYVKDIDDALGNPQQRPTDPHYRIGSRRTIR